MNQVVKNPLLEKHETTIKALAIGVLVLCLLIPVSMVESLIFERELRKEEVLREISAKWGRDQAIVGPILHIPYVEEIEDNSGRITRVTKSVYLLPETLSVTGEVLPQVRYRGIYEAVLYETDLSLAGVFSFDEIGKLNIPETSLLLSNASILIGISDITGIKEEVSFIWEEQPLKFNPGVSGKIVATGVSTNLESIDLTREQKFTAKISLRGSRGIEFAPVGLNTTVEIKSSWASPSFSGAFLPFDRDVSDRGFDASWKVLHFNRGYPQAWLNEQYQLSCSLFGVELLVLADGYQQSMRTLKYGVLFIALTFAAFFFSELFNKSRIHPIQYLLIGAGLVVFYTMLVAISEHSSFGLAYAVSAVLVTSLISFYAQSVLRSARLSFMVGSILTVLYTYLYFLLKMEDYALLFGALGLFVVLSLVMFFTRRFDWYNLSGDSSCGKED